MSEDVMLHEAVEAISLGQRTRARDLLTRLLRADQNNANYWIWMSAAVDSTSERIYCLESALRLDPYNSTAIRGLVLLGARPAEEDIKPAPAVRRKWGAAFEVPEPPKNLLVRVYENPVLRFLALSLTALLVIGIVLVGIFGVRAFIRNEPIFIVRVSITPKATRAFTLTPTLLTTNTPVMRSPTPTFVGPTPLKLMLAATYTPAPVYVNTPHIISEAYTAGLRAYAQQDYPAMLTFMLQASQNEPQAPDTHYYVGEAYRLLEEWDKAIEAYNQAIAVNESFAPAYVGRARTLLLLNPANDVERDFQKAVELDPNLVDTYIVRAGYLLDKEGEENVQAALDDLETAEKLFPDQPLIYVYRTQALLLQGQPEAALQEAQRAHELDFTSLPAYLALGRARLATGLPEAAIEALNTYLLFETKDQQGWLALGQAYYVVGENYEKAVEAFDQVLSLNEELDDPQAMAAAYHYRGLAYIALEEGQKATNDLTRALRMDPYSFEISVELGQALLIAERPGDAYRQLRSSEALVEPEAGPARDSQLARLYFWRAQALETIGNRPAAVLDWQALLALPEEAVPASLRSQAEERLRFLIPTSTPTRGASATPPPGPTRTPSRTPPTRTP
jgi:tetratricopeptide (TPR) repeat protein